MALWRCTATGPFAPPGFVPAAPRDAPQHAVNLTLMNGYHKISILRKNAKIADDALKVKGDVALRRFKAEVFQALAHPTRIHIAECLQEGELPVSTLLERLEIEPANLSQHLAVLRAKGLVVNRKEGAQVFYALRDPLLSDVLRNMRRYFQAHVAEALQILSKL